MPAVDPYSPILAAACVAAALAVAAGVANRLRWRRDTRGLSRLGRAAAGVSLALDLLGALAHLLLGHRPGTPAALDALAFAAAHPAFLVVALTALLALWLCRGWA